VTLLEHRIGVKRRQRGLVTVSGPAATQVIAAAILPPNPATGVLPATTRSFQERHRPPTTRHERGQRWQHTLLSVLSPSWRPWFGSARWMGERERQGYIGADAVTVNPDHGGGRCAQKSGEGCCAYRGSHPAMAGSLGSHSAPRRSRRRPTRRGGPTCHRARVNEAKPHREWEAGQWAHMPECEGRGSGQTTADAWDPLAIEWERARQQVWVVR
jgi:hypothetical protein